MKRSTAQRDKTIILVLLDTGLRKIELARLKVKDLNLETGELRIHPHGSGLKSKARSVYVGKLSKILYGDIFQEIDLQPNDNIFATLQGFSLNRTSIRQLLKR